MVQMRTRDRTRIREVDVEVVSNADHPDGPFPSLRAESTGAAQTGDDECEIVFWQGYVSATFYARLLTEENPLAAIAQSPFFRHRRNNPPEPNGATLTAHQALTKQLEHEGWRRVGTGPAWFSHRFGR